MKETIVCELIGVMLFYGLRWNADRLPAPATWACRAGAAGAVLAGYLVGMNLLGPGSGLGAATAALMGGITLLALGAPLAPRFAWAFSSAILVLLGASLILEVS